MTAQTPTERLAEIAARAAAATKGPWGTHDDGIVIDLAADLRENGTGYSCRRGIGRLDDEPIDNDPLHVDWDAEQDYSQLQADAAFIANAREDIPFLLAEVEQARSIAVRLEQENARLTAELAKYVGHEPTLTEEALFAHEEKVRARIAQDVNRAERPTFAEGERTDLVVSTTRAIDIRLIELGDQAPYWVAPKAGA